MQKITHAVKRVSVGNAAHASDSGAESDSRRLSSESERVGDEGGGDADTST